MKLGRNARIALKVGVSLIVVGCVLYFSDPRSVLKAVRGASPGWLLLAFLLQIPCYLICSWRWQILLQVQGIRIRLFRLLSLYFVATFFNLFLPTQLGGDVVRVIYTSRRGQSKSVPAMVALVERTSGTVAILLLALGAALLGFRGAERHVLVTTILAVLFAVVLVVFFLFHPSLEKGREKLAASRMPAIVREKGNRLYSALQAYGAKRRYLLAALGLSLVLQVCVVFYYYLIGFALGMDAGLLHFFLVVPAVYLTVAIPVFVGGLGGREVAFVILLGSLGVPSSQATALSLIFFAMMLVYGLIGGAVYSMATTDPLKEGEVGANGL